jgi:hypothetical protein
MSQNEIWCLKFIFFGRSILTTNTQDWPIIPKKDDFIHINNKVYKIFGACFSSEEKIITINLNKSF